jgi:hypothetical protein
MSNTQHQAIATAVAALLKADPALAGGRVYEGRDYTLGATVPNQVQVFLGDSTPQGVVITGAPVDWTTEVSVVIKARRSATDTAESVADALMFDVWARVMNNQNPSGLVYSLDPGPIERDRDEADTDVAAFTWRFEVQHRTANNSLA